MTRILQGRGSSGSGFDWVLTVLQGYWELWGGEALGVQGSNAVVGGGTCIPQR